MTTVFETLAGVEGFEVSVVAGADGAGEPLRLLLGDKVIFEEIPRFDREEGLGLGRTEEMVVVSSSSESVSDNKSNFSFMFPDLPPCFVRV